MSKTFKKIHRTACTEPASVKVGATSDGVPILHHFRRRRDNAPSLRQWVRGRISKGEATPAEVQWAQRKRL